MNVRFIAVALIALLLLTAPALFRFAGRSHKIVTRAGLAIELETDHDAQIQALKPGETKHLFTPPLHNVGGEASVVFVYSLSCMSLMDGEKEEIVGLVSVIILDEHEEIKRVIEVTADGTDPEELAFWFNKLEKHLHPPRIERPWIAVRAFSSLTAISFFFEIFTEK